MTSNQIKAENKAINEALRISRHYRRIAEKELSRRGMNEKDQRLAESIYDEALENAEIHLALARGLIDLMQVEINAMNAA